MNSKASQLRQQLDGAQGAGRCTWRRQLSYLYYCFKSSCSVFVFSWTLANSADLAFSSRHLQGPFTCNRWASVRRPSSLKLESPLRLSTGVFFSRSLPLKVRLTVMIGRVLVGVCRAAAFATCNEWHTIFMK